MGGFYLTSDSLVLCLIRCVPVLEGCGKVEADEAGVIDLDDRVRSSAQKW